jgi:hypothetical protein
MPTTIINIQPAIANGFLAPTATVGIQPAMLTAFLRE